MTHYWAAALLLYAAAVPAHSTMRAVTAPTVLPGAQVGAVGASGLAIMRVPSLSGTLTLTPSMPGLVSPTLSVTPSVSPVLSVQTQSLALPVSKALSVPAARKVSLSKSVALPVPGAVKGQGIRAALSQQVQAIGKAQARDSSGMSSKGHLDSMFYGRSGGGSVVAAASRGTITNDEGVHVMGRSIPYYKEVRRIVDKYKGKLNLEESLDVMDDSYGDVWAKLKALEALAKNRGVDDHNTHLERTLTWVDGVMHQNGRKVAVHTYRVYYHHAKNKKSEISEGIRRTNGYLKDMARLFSKGGKAERAMGKFDEIVLAFDTRGYKQIKDFLKGKEAEFKKQYGPRFRFEYLDDYAKEPATEEETRAELNTLIEKYKNDEGLQKIVEGVIYSRYVGMLLELKTVEYYVDKGYELLQSGHELFDTDGMYVTELDLIVRSPEGKTALVEAKSARVPLPFEEVLEDKVLKKLDTYKAHWDELEKSAGYPIDAVVFAFDVGPNRALANYLKAQERDLGILLGKPVIFLFVDSTPKKAGQEVQGRAPKHHKSGKHGKRRRR